MWLMESFFSSWSRKIPLKRKVILYYGASTSIDCAAVATSAEGLELSVEPQSAWLARRIGPLGLSVCHFWPAHTCYAHDGGEGDFNKAVLSFQRVL